MPLTICTTGSYSPRSLPTPHGSTPKPRPRRSPPICTAAGHRLRFMTRKTFEIASTPVDVKPPAPKTPAAIKKAEEQKAAQLSDVFNQVVAHKGKIPVQYTTARFG